MKIFFLVLTLTGIACAQSGFQIKPNDTVVFYGDSITDQRQYTVLTETYIVTRFPRYNVRFVHSGWGGDRVSGGGGGPVEERVKRDVIPYKPTVVTIMLGMNDGRYRAFDDEIFKTFSTGFEKLVTMIKEGAPGVRMTYIQPSPYDDVTRAPMFNGGYNEVLVRYGAYLKQLAARTDSQIADLNSGVVAMLQKANAADAENAKKIVPDRVHPGWGGHLIMAAELLKAWGAPKTVTSVEIDAAAGRVVSSVNTVVTDWKSGSGYTWRQKDAALPMPLPEKTPAVLLAVKSSDFMESLNQEILKVAGLRAGRYSLRINGTAVGTFAADDLAKGVNLAEYPTPMMKQAEEVHAFTLKRTNVHQMRWRQLQMPLEKESYGRMATILENLDALDNEIAVRQRAAAQPVEFYYELTPAN
jgi:lysophospholipase L1-like esterase